QDLQLVLRAEPSSARSSFYFRVGARLALDRRRPSAAGRLASLAAPSLRLSHGRLFSIGPPDSIHRSFPFTPCSLNSGGVKCLIYIGREGRRLTVPLVVVTAGRGADAVWRDLQRDQVGLSERGCQVIADQSGHAVAVGQPQVVVDAIRATVDAARGRRGVALC